MTKEEENIDYRIACNMQEIAELKAEIKQLKHETDELLLTRMHGRRKKEDDE